MGETTKPKKLRIYKFASEYNLASEALVEFLISKGHEVKSHMSVLSDEMLSDVNEHFKKDIESAQKHYRKVSEFNKKRSEKSEEEIAKEIEKKEQKVEEQPEEEEIVDRSVEDKVESEEKTESAVSEEHEVVAKTESEEPKEQSKPEEEESKTFRTQSEIDLEKKKKGLTVVGKIDVDKKRSPKPSKIEDKGSPKSKDTAAKDSDAELPKKKKKKVLKAKKKGKGEEEDNVKSKKKRKLKRLEVDKKEVEAAIKRTMLSMDSATVPDRASARKKKRKEKHDIEEQKLQEKIERDSTTLRVTEFIAVNELANLMNVPVSDVIQKCIGLGIMVSINQRLDVETITLVADEFGFDVEFQEEYSVDLLEDTKDPSDTLKPRSPVVTIMGHVDHGKTSLLDYIRKENVVAGEAGGITQHIGAYRVKVSDDKQITFLDTPGHEAFTAMRARGAKVTDIVVLIVAADDAVMPQTVEAINHSQAAGVPIIVAINKIDKPGANIEKIKQQLADRNVLVEDWGGKHQCVEISAKAGTNIDLLLEKIILESELLELKANPDRNARGIVIESQLDKGRGVTSTILVQKGTLRVGDPFVAGNYQGRVRAMFDERNNKIDEVGPSAPAVVLGFEGAPQAGDTFVVVDSEREAREISLKRQQLHREQAHRQVKLITLDEIANQISQGGIKELLLVVKGDVDGSVEALSDSLMKLSNKEVVVKVIHKGVGAITEGDVLLAAASEAIIIGFHVRPNLNARKVAEAEHVDIRLYNVIYDAINEVKSALEGMLSPVLSEEVVATVEVRDTFKVPRAGTVAGCYVQDGKISRNSKIRLFRDGVAVYEGELDTLKRFKDDVKEVDAGYECGIKIANYNDIKIGDIIEAYKIVETKKKLES
ncbi:MAG: translation initiation factor IF-2 [Melioribacteraceae bacterium]|nr:translation initiation factor IF-2 [Melioribacteraceae bacterium]